MSASRTLLVDMEISAITMENSMEVPQELKIDVSYDPYLTTSYVPRGKEGDGYTPMNYCIIHTSQATESTRYPWMNGCNKMEHTQTHMHTRTHTHAHTHYLNIKK